MIRNLCAATAAGLSIHLAGAAVIAMPLFPAGRAPSAADEAPLQPNVALHPSNDHFNTMQPPYVGPPFLVGSGGVPDLAFSASGVRLMAWLPIGYFDPAAQNANSCYGYTSPSGREYAILGTQTGTGFVEITDPGAPVIVAHLTGPTSLWRDMKTYGTYAYSVSEGGSGIQVFNLSNIDSGAVTFVRSVVTTGTTATHTIHINEQSGYLYRCGGGTSPTMGLRIYNLNPDPSNPVYVSQWNNRYVHECQVVNWTTGALAGRELAFIFADDVSNGGNPRVDILDVTNKAAITVVAQVGYPNGSFSHQGWLSPDRRYLYHDDELDESSFNIFSRTRIFDVSNPAAPFYVGSFTNGLTNIDHNLYTKGNLIFESNYRAGLRIFDATDPLAPFEIAHFDTYLEDDQPSFNGLWNNYPYFNSGTIIGSDIEKGLFVWRMGPAELAFSFPDGMPSMIPAQGGSLRVRITPAEGQSVSPGTPALKYNIGAGENSVALVPIGGELYRATIPALPCGSTFRYYVTAKTGAGLTARDPSTAPTTTNEAIIGTASNLGLFDDMETNTGWTVGAPGDNATAGLWVRADPVGTAAQPEDDATPAPGVNCFITGNGTVGGSVGAADVDGGATTLTSPLLDAAAMPGVPVLRYARWYSNNQGADPNNDTMTILISNNNGGSWSTLELVNENAGLWVRKTFVISDIIAPTSQMRVRFVASDLGAGSVVEAGVDDLRIDYVDCTAVPPPGCPGDSDGDLDRDFADITAVLANFGVIYATFDGLGDADHDGAVTFADITAVLGQFGLPCP
ncbi:MAG: choice-of-anchor B family protein [Phycisphaerae bacterium]|nr:choice-of-anchor B family protein [Phycisphaerae bacterium]